MPNPQSTAKVAGHPILPMLVPFPIAFFVGAFLADLMYWNTADMFWFTATEWLLGVGVVMALVAATAGFIDFMGDTRIRAMTIAWAHFIGNFVIVLIEAANWYNRYEFGPGAVLPTGIILSAIAVAGLLVTGWLGGEMVFMRRVAVAEADAAEQERERYRRAA